MHALLVDDDRELARLLGDYLGSHGVSLVHVDDGARAIERVATETFDIVLLDVMLPSIDGFEVCRRIRASYSVPIIMLTARGDDADRVVGLDIGSDDYVPKPFNPRELLARMHAVLRRVRRTTEDRAQDRVEVGDLVIDVPAHRATLGGRELSLTSFELRVLIALARRAGETVTREELANVVLPKGDRYDPSVDRSLDVHVSHLRHKLGDDAKEPRRIRTVRGVGYVLVKPA
jgi:DNA-binding response OmpR family regulator